MAHTHVLWWDFTFGVYVGLWLFQVTFPSYFLSSCYLPRMATGISSTLLISSDLMDVAPVWEITHTPLAFAAGYSVCEERHWLIWTGVPSSAFGFSFSLHSLKSIGKEC